MQNLSINPNETICVNGAILNAKMLSEILFLQTGQEKDSEGILKENYGIRENIEENQKLINFIASEAMVFNNQEGALKSLEIVFNNMKYSQVFRLPGTEEIFLF